MKVWIDIDNPPQVQYLLPLRAGFQEAGADVVVTARNNGITLDLLRRDGADFHAVGERFGKARHQKAVGLLKRSYALAAFFRDEGRPDVLVSSSRSSALVARGMGIPAFIMCDYEHVEFGIARLAGSYILFPDVIDARVFEEKGVPRSKLIPFHGLKEDISFANVPIEEIPPHSFAEIENEELVKVLFRPPAEETHYYTPDSRRLALQMLEHLAGREDAVVIFTPRYPWQAEYLERLQWRNPPVLVREAIPFVSLLKGVDMVISSGGTMLREAAYLGVPAFSIFQSKSGGVDRYLESIGRVAFVSGPGDFGKLEFRKAERRLLETRNPRVLEHLVERISAKVEERKLGVDAGERSAVAAFANGTPPVRVAQPTGIGEDVFDSSRPFLFFDYFRVPYQAARHDEERLPGIGSSHPLRSCGHVRWRGADGSTRSLYWPLCTERALSSNGRLPSREYHVDDAIPIFGHVVPDGVAQDWLGDVGGGWTPSTRITDNSGKVVASVWRNEQGDILLPFDPCEAIQNYWSEGYQTVGGLPVFSRVKKVATRSYYRVRPALPRTSQIFMRQLFSRVQARSRFPRWPVETALDDLYGFLFRTVTELARQPVPWLSPWPDGHTWALILTHDVETSVGYGNLDPVRDVERRSGFRSSWNFVPRRYPVDDALVKRLIREGFEVGVHGLYHDGRDLESLPMLYERLPDIRDYAKRWNAAGFRSSSTQRAWEWMPLLGFDYDSSYPDTDPFEPQAGGCCSWLPYFNEALVELPITLPQDHTLFVILRHADETLWLEKASYLRSKGGMALLVTHPDYMLEQRFVDAYARFLATFEDDRAVWRALPREVSAWWRRRAASHLEPVHGEWQVVGPAAGEGRVRFTDSA